MTKLIETKNQLVKGDDRFVKESGGLSVIIGTEGIWLSIGEVQLLAYWLRKNFDINFLPGFKEAIQYEQQNIEIRDLKNMIMRLASTLEGLVAADEIKGKFLSEEALYQIKLTIQDAKKIQD